MDTAVGVDWGGKRWVAAAADGDGVSVATAPSIQALAGRHGDAGRILIDVPIGLPGGPAATPRPCDEAAREFLGGSRRRSVFDVPARAAVRAPTHEAAVRRNEAVLGDDHVGPQAWGIAERIHEVDAFLRECDPSVAIRESHPEVCFAALAGTETVADSKADPAGLETRLSVLDGVDPVYRREFEAVRDRVEATAPWKRRIGAGMLDDVVDAMVLAATARLGAERGFQVLGGEVDEAGLPMEIVYAEPE